MRVSIMQRKGRTSTKGKLGLTSVSHYLRSWHAAIRCYGDGSAYHDIPVPELSRGIMSGWTEVNLTPGLYRIDEGPDGRRWILVPVVGNAPVPLTAWQGNRCKRDPGAFAADPATVPAEPPPKPRTTRWGPDAAKRRHGFRCGYSMAEYLDAHPEDEAWVEQHRVEQHRVVEVQVQSVVSSDRWAWLDGVGLKVIWMGLTRDGRQRTKLESADGAGVVWVDTARVSLKPPAEPVDNCEALQDEAEYTELADWRGRVATDAA